MLKHPSHRFVKYLMTSPNVNAFDDKWVQHSITSLEYPPVDGELISFIRSDLAARIPDGFQPQNKYHRDSVRFLRAEGIYSLHHMDKATREANLLVTDYSARPLIEGLLLGRHDPKSIAKKINARLGSFHTAEAIEAYSHYYWDVRSIKVDDWEKIFKEHAAQASVVRSIVQAGPAMALHKLGFAQQLESKSILREVMDGLYFDFKEWQTRPLSEGKTRSLTAIAKSICGVNDQLSHADSALKDSLKAFEQFRMEHAQGHVKGILDIAPAGNYSGSGVKLLETNKKED